MDLKGRLARLDRSGGMPAKGGAKEARTFPPELGLELRSGPGGDLWQRDLDLPLPIPDHPATVLEGALTRPVPADFQWTDILLLDTETTGLAGGTGTVPFLVGVGWWENDATFRMRQTMLAGPGGESAMIADLVELAARFGVIGTFNGHSYDLPLLRSRAILARQRGLFAGHGTWDLLPLARRLWGRRLPDCRQGTVERLVVGREREGEDIPGSQIPGTWLGFVKQGDVGSLGTVLDHNAWDLDGMAGLLRSAVAACELGRRGPDAASESNLDWRDRWSLARLAESRHERDLEAAWIADAVKAAPLGADRLRLRLGPPESFLADAVRMIKRTGDWPAVERLIAAGLRLDPAAAWLHREAAILYEHRLVDLPRALGHARRSGEADRVARLDRRLDASTIARPRGGG